MVRHINNSRGLDNWGRKLENKHLYFYIIHTTYTFTLVHVEAYTEPL